METELKLHIAAEHQVRLKRHPLLKKIAATRAVTRKLHSVYYDTPDLKLQRHGLALRLRRAGGRWLQTMKDRGTVHAGLHQRNEWETPVAGQAFDFERLETDGATHLSKAARKKLQAVFVTDFSRTSRMVVFAGAEIELSLDTGKISAAQATHPISELELELKSGEPLQLFRLALLLLDIVPLEIEAVSKAQYGYRLFAPAEPVPVKAQPPELAAQMALPDALQSMVWSSLLHLQHNMPGLMHRLEDEFLHQVRVALRRLRVALSIVANFHDDDAELAALRAELAALFARLGRAREWDVFVTQTLAAAQVPAAESLALGQVMAAGEQLRQQQRAEVQHALQAPDLQRLLLRLGVWIHGNLQQSAGQAASLPQLAARVLQRRSKQVDRLGREIKPDATADQLHKLRIACKKLRYGAELLAPLYPRHQVKRYLAGLTRLQDLLGELHDNAVAHSLLEDAGTVGHPAGGQAAAPIHAWLQHEWSQRVTGFGRAWHRFSRQKKFWR